MCHLYALENGIKDTSRGNTYHNKKFKEIAEARGLEIEHDPRIGYSITKPGIDLLEFVIEQGWENIQMTDGNIRDYFSTGGNKTGKGTGTGTIEPKPKKPSSTRKYICPICGCSCRATKNIRIMCMDCNEQMVIEN